MAQTLNEQLDTIERSLGERMIDHALVIVRAWLTELGENNPYEEAFVSIQNRYQEFFSDWLSAESQDEDPKLNELTGETYQLVDSVYADIRIARGLSPQMHGFNPENEQSVMNYFQYSVRFRPEDLEWFHEILQDEHRTTIALLAITALNLNLRQCFSTDSMLALIDGMNSSNKIVADQCIAHTMLLLIHYDIRLDFFPQIQEAFIQAIWEMDDAGAHAFEVLCSLVEATEHQLHKLMEIIGLDKDLDSLMQWAPQSESEYLSGLIEILPHTWLYETMVRDSEMREKVLVEVCVSAGYREMMWDYPEVADQVYLKLLRKGSNKPIDYINHANCLLLKGDRMMAYENYRQARKLSKSPKEFFNLFRPDRRQLIDHGVPVGQVYLLEDQLLKN